MRPRQRLSEDPHTRVLLIEAGGADTKREIRIPLAWLKLFKSEVDWDYTTTPQAGLGGRRVYWPRGKTLGGCSSTNAMIAIPGHRADYDGWADLGNEGWSFDELAPVFERVSDALAVEELRDPNALTHACIEAAVQAGIPRSRKLGPTDLEGVRQTPVTQRRGRRWSAADAYLRPALRRPNLTVTTGAQVTRVLFDGTRAVGVAYRHGADEKIARCAREVILSGGAVNSPQLLLLSGVGPLGELARHRIKPVRELPGVGLNLQDHPVVSFLVEAVQPTTLYAAETARNLARYLLFRRGMLTSNAAEAAAFIHSRPGLPAPDLELMFAPGLFQNEGLTPASAHGFTIMAIALQPHSVGAVRLRSADPLAKPEIDPELPLRPGRHRPASADRRPRASAPDRLHALPRQAGRRRDRAGPRVPPGTHPRHRSRALSPHRHLPHGRRRASRRRPPTARPRTRRPARRRRLRHSQDPPRPHQPANHNRRRQGGRPDPRHHTDQPTRDRGSRVATRGELCLRRNQ